MSENELVVRIKSDGTAQVVGELNKVSGSVENMGKKTGSVTESFRNFAASIAGVWAVAKGMDLATHLIPDYVKLNAAREHTISFFKTMIGSAQEAKKVWEDLERRQFKIPFDDDTMADAARIFMNFGLNYKAFMPEASMLALAFSRNLDEAKGNLWGVAELLGRIRTGQASMAMRQLRRYGIGAEDLAQYGINLDKTSGEYTGDTEKLLEAIRQIIRKKYPDIIEEMNKGAMGLAENIRKNIEEIGESTTAELFQRLKVDGVKITDWFEKMRDNGQIEEWAKNAGRALADTFDRAVELAKGGEKVVAWWKDLDAGTKKFVKDAVMAGGVIWGLEQIVGLMKSLAATKTVNLALDISLMLMGKKIPASVLGKIGAGAVGGLPGIIAALLTAGAIEGATVAETSKWGRVQRESSSDRSTAQARLAQLNAWLVDSSKNQNPYDVQAWKAEIEQIKKKFAQWHKSATLGRIEGGFLNKESADKWNALISEAAKEGIKVRVNRAFATYAEQAAIYAKYGPGRAAKPGTSPHEMAGGARAVDFDVIAGSRSRFLELAAEAGFARTTWEDWHLEDVGKERAESLLMGKSSKTTLTKEQIQAALEKRWKPIKEYLEIAIEIGEITEMQKTVLLNQYLAKGIVPEKEIPGAKKDIAKYYGSIINKTLTSSRQALDAAMKTQEEAIKAWQEFTGDKYAVRGMPMTPGTEKFQKFWAVGDRAWEAARMFGARATEYTPGAGQVEEQEFRQYEKDLELQVQTGKMSNTQKLQLEIEYWKKKRALGIAGAEGYIRDLTYTLSAAKYQLPDLGETLFSTYKQGMDDIIKQTGTVGDMLGNMWRNIGQQLQQAIYNATVRPLFDVVGGAIGQAIGSIFGGGPHPHKGDAKEQTKAFGKAVGKEVAKETEAASGGVAKNPIIAAIVGTAINYIIGAATSSQQTTKQTVQQPWESNEMIALRTLQGTPSYLQGISDQMLEWMNRILPGTPGGSGISPTMLSLINAQRPSTAEATNFPTLPVSAFASTTGVQLNQIMRGAVNSGLPSSTHSYFQNLLGQAQTLLTNALQDMAPAEWMTDALENTRTAIQEFAYQYQQGSETAQNIWDYFLEQFSDVINQGGGITQLTVTNPFTGAVTRATINPDGTVTTAGAGSSGSGGSIGGSTGGSVWEDFIRETAAATSGTATEAYSAIQTEALVNISETLNKGFTLDFAAISETLQKSLFDVRLMAIDPQIMSRLMAAANAGGAVIPTGGAGGTGGAGATTGGTTATSGGGVSWSAINPTEEAQNAAAAAISLIQSIPPSQSILNQLQSMRAIGSEYDTTYTLGTDIPIQNAMSSISGLSEWAGQAGPNWMQQLADAMNAAMPTIGRTWDVAPEYRNPVNVTITGPIQINPNSPKGTLDKAVSDGIRDYTGTQNFSISLGAL